ncbi:cell surface protein [Rhodopirellula maiorica SM1]|uniref:Cell surface protein n=1 Tax=Rhodopirellula maiorica SM1 TaxID=1265738 RepID=M5RQI7_9BACT|nr:DUF4465 domain-containing protein [Rhodopirellula maiorica]EMI21560.1 cell surface protein [Rhodopirellula maiorica SM1]
MRQRTNQLRRRRRLITERLEDRRLMAAGPYAPAAGETGSTAIAMDDPAIVAWATDWQNYDAGSDVSETFQTPAKALGPAAGTSFDIVSLGRGGKITLQFDIPIRDGLGADFAVFENSVTDTFLELAFVEVSSNGSDFFRFDTDSLTDSSVGGFGSIDPTNIDGFAGKYRQGFGTPFDLNDLAGVSANLDISAITHVRIVDIVGDGTQTDSSGDTVYDPYPTVGSAGFDLDAIGVINQAPYDVSSVGFEDVGQSLTPESHWNGPVSGGTTSEGPYGDQVTKGEFASDEAQLNNAYSLDYGSWSGWAYSNETNTSTPGFTNQFSAIAGGGANDSDTYGVAFASATGENVATITLPEDAGSLQSVQITNTTYTALSMQNGDSFAKKFGGVSGTEADWFLLTIQGKDDSGTSVGMVDFYLADYRSDDSSQDYIIDAWTEVDLSSLAGANSLEFWVTSSDVGPFGMNTPAYFAMDELSFLTPGIAVDVLDHAIVENAGAAATTGRVTRGEDDLSAAMTVSLSSDTAGLIVPSTVTIPAGQAFVDFTIGVTDNSLAGGDVVAAITATTGDLQAVRVITINDDELPTLTVSVASDTMDEGTTVSGTLTRINTDTTQSLTVQLSSSSPSIAAVDSTVTIPAGATSTTFTILAVDDDVDHGTTTVQLTATATGFLSLPSSVDVNDNDQPAIRVTASESTFSESDVATTTQFEDLGIGLANESFDNGAAGNGEFVSNGLILNNAYNATYGSWSGWAISNTTDTTTPGYLNQYSAIAGAGAYGSRTYAVSSGYAADPPSITRDADNGIGFQQLSITNTTYAALSMANGDTFAKQFGGADGSDPDWFLLTIEGVDEAGDSVGTVEFYLADYRFDDDSLDYIVDDWSVVDVSSLENAVKLEFALSSSDVGDFGMNTPAYFAVDDVVIAETIDPANPAPSITVSRQNMDFSEPLDVTLTVSDASQLRVPVEVTIPAGRASVEVLLDIVDDIVVDGDAVVTITATADSLSSETTVTIEDDDESALVVTLGVGELDESLGIADADFEDAGLRLLGNSFYKGQDGAGSFQSGNLGFANSYNPAWGSWSGWALSNTTDQTTAGYGNQFSAFAGSGANGSSTYAVGTGVTGNSAAVIQKNSDGLFDSLMVTNTTYAALSMSQGDAFAKKFGGESGDDPDYLLLTIEGLDASDQSIGTVTFYLADYRFADNSLDYIVQDWTKVDLTQLAAADRLELSVASSDVGAFGMNTPAYFAVDDVQIQPANEPAGYGVVHRNDDDLSSPLVVAIDADPSNRLLLPATVTIPAGSAVAEFSFDVINDVIANGDATIEISAAVDGYTSVPGQFSVLDDDEQQIGLWLDQLSFAEDAGDGAVTGVISRNDANLDSAIEVSIDVDGADGIVLPVTVTIPAGSRSVAFTGDVVSDGLAGQDQTATITAQGDGYVASTAAIELTEVDEPVLSIEFSEAVVNENDGEAAVELTVSRNTLDVSESLVVSLQGIVDTRFDLPDSITIPANLRSASITIDLINNVRLDGDREEQVTGTADGFADGVGTIQVVDDEVAGIEIVTSGDELQVSELGTFATFEIRLTAQPASDVVLAVAESASGDYELDPTRVVFTSENWSVPQTVTVSGIADFVIEENETHSIVVSVVSGESDAGFATAESVSLSLTIEEVAVENVELVSQDDVLLIRDLDSENTFALTETDDGLRWVGDDRAQQLLVDSVVVGDQTVTLDLAGGNDEVTLTGLSTVNINGGEGFDRLTVTLSESEIDLAAFLANQIRGFEEVVVATTEAKLLSLDANAIAQAFGSDTSMVLHIGVSQLIASDDWTLEDPTIVSGVFAQVLRFDGVEILVISDSPWRNSRDRWDVNNSGSVTASDALTIINRLPLQGESSLPVIETLADFTGMYYDVSGDGKITALDALNVINRMNNSIVTPTAESEFSTALPFPAATPDVVGLPLATPAVTTPSGRTGVAESDVAADFIADVSFPSVVGSSHHSSEIIDQVMREFSGDFSDVSDEIESSSDAFDWDMLGDLR